MKSIKITLIRSLFSLILFLIVFVLHSSQAPQIRAADPCPTGYQCEGGCTSAGKCVNNTYCISLNQGPGNPILLRPGSQPCGAGIIGGINPPQGVARYNLTVEQGGGSIGILLFVSNALKFFAVLCGLLVFFNILYAGYEYIVGAGKTDVHVKVRERLTWSVIGLILLIGAYMIAALIGLFIFGDPAFLLNPDLTKYGALAP